MRWTDREDLNITIGWTCHCRFKPKTDNDVPWRAVTVGFLKSNSDQAGSEKTKFVVVTYVGQAVSCSRGGSQTDQTQTEVT